MSWEAGAFTRDSTRLLPPDSSRDIPDIPSEIVLWVILWGWEGSLLSDSRSHYKGPGLGLMAEELYSRLHRSAYLLYGVVAGHGRYVSAYVELSWFSSLARHLTLLGV